MSKMKSPWAGLAMAFFCADVKRGRRTPLFVLTTSRMAEGSGFSVPMPMLSCPKTEQEINNQKKVSCEVNFISRG
jgi:hypothetical protein